MRGMFGLVGLLAAILVVIMLWMNQHPADVVRQAQPAKERVEQMAGVDSQGMRAKDSITLDPVSTNGKLRYVLVEDIVPGGPMQKFYGLKRNDSIISAGPLDFKDQDGEMAIELIMRAYQTQAPIVVIRDGRRIELPQPATPTPAAPTGRDDTSPIHRQLEALPRLP